jgi:hypothetical protein
VLAVPRLCELYLGIGLKTEDGKTSISRLREMLQLEKEAYRKAQNKTE